MNEEQSKKLSNARKNTSAAIAAVAQAKYKLEEIRKDFSAQPEAIALAAREWREAEQHMQEIVDVEIEVVTKVALEQAEKSQMQSEV